MPNPFSKRIEQLKQRHPSKSIDTIDIISIDGTKLFNRRQLMDIMMLSDTAIKDYSKRGMPRSDYSLGNYTLYDLYECIAWIAINVDHSQSKMSKRVKSSGVENEDAEDLASLPVRKLRAETQKLEEQSQIEKLKRLRLEGTLVEKVATDRAMAEVGATMGAFYRNDLKVLPVLLNGKNAISIKQELNSHYRGRMDDMHRIATTKLDTNETIYQKVFEWVKEQIC